MLVPLTWHNVLLISFYQRRLAVVSLWLQNTCLLFKVHPNHHCHHNYILFNEYDVMFVRTISIAIYHFNMFYHSAIIVRQVVNANVSGNSWTRFEIDSDTYDKYATQLSCRYNQTFTYSEEYNLQLVHSYKQKTKMRFPILVC